MSRGSILTESDILLVDLLVVKPPMLILTLLKMGNLDCVIEFQGSMFKKSLYGN